MVRDPPRDPRRFGSRPRRDVGTSLDRLETETSRPRPHPWALEILITAVIQIIYIYNSGIVRTSELYTLCYVPGTCRRIPAKEPLVFDEYSYINFGCVTPLDSFGFICIAIALLLHSHLSLCDMYAFCSKFHFIFGQFSTLLKPIHCPAMQSYNKQVPDFQNIFWCVHRKIDGKSVVSSPLVMLYDLTYDYRNYVLTFSYDNPKTNLVVKWS